MTERGEPSPAPTGRISQPEENVSLGGYLPTDLAGAIQLPEEAGELQPTTDAVVAMIRGLRKQLGLGREGHLSVTLNVHPAVQVNREALDAVERSENVTLTLVPLEVKG